METIINYSKDRKHIYYVSERWDKSKPLIMFIGLNPAERRAKQNPTIESCIRIAKSLNYGGIYFCNLFTKITDKPHELKISSESKAENERLSTISLYANKVIFCWGGFKQATERAKEVIKLFPNAYCLGKNKNGSPKHPLFLKSNTKLINFN